MEDERGCSTPLDPRKSRILFMAAIVPHGWTRERQTFYSLSGGAGANNSWGGSGSGIFHGSPVQVLGFQGGIFLLIHFSLLKCGCSCNYSHFEFGEGIILMILSSSCLVFSSSSSLSILLPTAFLSFLACLSWALLPDWCPARLQPERKYKKKDIQHLEM